MSKHNEAITIRNAFYSIGILNVIEILQTIPFYPTYEANPFFRQYPYILFTYKVLMFVIIIPFVFPRLLEKYGEDSALKEFSQFGQLDHYPITKTSPFWCSFGVHASSMGTSPYMEH